MYIDYIKDQINAKSHMFQIMQIYVQSLCLKMTEKKQKQKDT